MLLTCSITFLAIGVESYIPDAEKDVSANPDISISFLVYCFFIEFLLDFSRFMVPRTHYSWYCLPSRLMI